MIERNVDRGIQVGPVGEFRTRKWVVGAANASFTDYGDDEVGALLGMLDHAVTLLVYNFNIDGANILYGLDRIGKVFDCPSNSVNSVCNGEDVIAEEEPERWLFTYSKTFSPSPLFLQRLLQTTSQARMLNSRQYASDKTPLLLC